MLIAIVAVFLALLTGCAVAYFISQNFHGEVTSVSTNILPINTENCPETIEEIYNISDIPMGFEKISDNSDPFSRTFEYMNSSTKQMIVFSQYAKPGLGTLNLNTESAEPASVVSLFGITETMFLKYLPIYPKKRL